MIVHFKGAKIEIENVDEQQFSEIRERLVNQLGIQSRKRDAISETFFYAVKLCPDANPSDVWHHIIYRHFVALPNKSNSNQSWVRAGGEALEVFFERYYNTLFAEHKIRMRSLIGRLAKRDALLVMQIPNVGDAKLDTVLEGQTEEGDYQIFGGAHIKGSLAERISDDEPTSRAMMSKGLFSPLLTLDVKSFPPPRGDLVNRGELGSIEKPSEKRKYIELHGSFDNCYSYNLRTMPSKPPTPSGKYIKVQGLKFKEDAFVADTVSRWETLLKKSA
jgi:hypothetical protein